MSILRPPAIAATLLFSLHTAGLSPWMSRRVKIFLKEIQGSNFWTHCNIIALSLLLPTAQSSKLCIQLTFFYVLTCSQLILAGTKTACCCSKQPAWTVCTARLLSMQRIAFTGQWCCCASSSGRTCQTVSATARAGVTVFMCNILCSCNWHKAHAWYGYPADCVRPGTLERSHVG